MPGMDWGAGNFRGVSDTASVLIPSYVSQRVGREYNPNEAQATHELPMIIRVDDTEFYVGTGAPNWGRPIDNLDDSRFVNGSPELRALLYGVLTRMNGGRKLDLLVGLPQSTWETDREKPEDQIREWLVGKHVWAADGVSHSCTVGKVGVVSQPVGALYDHILDDDGQPIKENAAACWSKETAVVSVGFSTLELSVVTLDNPPVIAPRFTASATAGIRRLLRLSDPQNRYSLAELDAQLRRDSAFVQPMVAAWGAEVTGLIEQHWDDHWQRFARIIVVGGGSILLRQQLNEFFSGRAYFAPQPIFAVALGLYKLEKMRHGKAKG